MFCWCFSVHEFKDIFFCFQICVCGRLQYSQKKQ
nr:MAG TPA: hypothetical protein [Caudoviricetes sp.]